MSRSQLSIIERKLLGKSASRCAITAGALLALQVPMWQALGDGAGSCQVPMRLSILLDLGLIAAMVIASIRVSEYFFASHPSPRCGRIGATAAGVLVIAAAVNLAEDIVLWTRFGSGATNVACPSTHVFLLTPLFWVLGAGSAVVLAGAVFWARRQMAAGVGDPMRKAELREDGEGGPRPGTIIACSGGGIRSASFSLGALQALMTGGIYRSAHTVVGVSGGGYMAAAFHLAGRDLKEDDQPPFAQGTPELALLRRNTRYLLPRGTEVFRGVMSVLYGVAVNIACMVVTLWAMAWVLGWYLTEYGGVPRPSADAVVDAPFTFDPSGTWLAVALGPWALAILSFVFMEKLVDRFVQVPDRVRLGTRSVIRTGLVVGWATVILMLAVPAALAWLSRPEHDDGSVVGELWGLVGSTGFDLETSTATLAGLVVALVGLGRTVVTGLTRAGEAGGKLAALVSWLRVKVAPWLGSAVILAGAFLLLLRLTHGYAAHPGWAGDWDVAVKLAVVIVLIRMFTDANRTSLHNFYKERLSGAYLIRRQGRSSAEARSYDTPLTVSSYALPDTDSPSGPQLVMAAVANVVDQEFVPTGRGCVPFIIAPDRTGVLGDRSLPQGSTLPTGLYEAFADYGRRDLTIPAAMAISGAAVSPLTGRASARTRPVRVLLTVLNARLGVWLPNPYAVPPRLVSDAIRAREDWDGSPPEQRTTARRMRLIAAESLAGLVSVAAKPGPYRLLREAFGRPSLYDRKLYVTDGGHYDNLGLLEALRRRPERVIVIDASEDAGNTFSALGEAIATARMDLGVEVSVDLTPLRADDGERPVQAWARGTASYDDSALTTEVIYLKARLVPGLTWDVETYAHRHADFPNRSTGDQFYDEWDFEAYRELGHTLARQMVDGITPQFRKRRKKTIPTPRLIEEPRLVEELAPARLVEELAQQASRNQPPPQPDITNGDPDVRAGSPRPTPTEAP